MEQKSLVDISFQTLNSDDHAPLTPVICVHGTGGNGNKIREKVSDIASRLINFPALLVYPSFHHGYQFLGNQDYSLFEAINLKSSEFPLKKELFLYGFSGGAQFCHRFIWRNPTLVKACALFAAGSWTLTDGTFIGMMADENWLEKEDWNNPAFEKKSTCPAKNGYENISWLTGCGTEDLPRIRSANQFFEHMKDQNTDINWTDWPAAHEVTDETLEKIFSFFNTNAEPRHKKI